MKSDKEFIKEVYNKYEKCKKENKTVKVNKEKIKKNNIVKFLSIAAVVLITFSFILINSKQNNHLYEYSQTDQKVLDNISLATVDNFEKFYGIIKNTNLSNQNKYDSIKRN